jgi:hypothetical protein
MDEPNHEEEAGQNRNCNLDSAPSGAAVLLGDFAFFVQGLRSGNFTKKIRGNFKTQKTNPLRIISRWEYSQRVSVVPIFSEPAPSHRPWTFASGATPVRTKPNYHEAYEKPGKIGTFYFARNRNFLLCLDISPLVVIVRPLAVNRKG